MISSGLVMVTEKTTVEELNAVALDKLGINKGPGEEYKIFMFCQETGALRRLQSTEHPLAVHDEMVLQNVLRKGGSTVVNIKCFLQKVLFSFLFSALFFFLFFFFFFLISALLSET